MLQSYTIVPSNLYVERDADRQIRQVINSMTRPGYILVARQMGKTNLLLHTKEVLEDERNIFTYVDFTSAICRTESECYDEIIDITLDTHKDIFKEQAKIIESRRNSRQMTTQREFTRDLRLLLDVVDKLVIILDEIDALTRLPYSDNVFSLIRSHYFQRKNYPDMSKLSYLLSGVMEPKDIIKNPDISPFNIGQEIYVKDFTKHEFDIFVLQAGLKEKYNNDILDSIFMWTCGHPRLTWDLCQLIDEEGVNKPSDIEDIVNKYYLATCDKAPIDGVRKLVANDSELRDIVLQMIYGLGDSLSADQRKKLYLGGIINYDDVNIKFKNPILEKSLPLDWVKIQGNKTIDTRDAIDRAQRLLYIQKDYIGAQLVLETLMKTSEKDDATDRVLLLLGESLMRQYQNKKAISYLEDIKDDSVHYPDALFLKAQNFFNLYQFDDALIVYRQCLKLKDDHTYINKVNLGIVETIIEKKDASLYSDAERILKKMMDDGVRENINYTPTPQILYFSALIYENREDYNSAISILDSALGYSQNDEQIVLLYHKYKCTEQREKKEELIKDIVVLMKEYNGRPSSDDFDNVLAFSKYYALLIFAEVILNYSHLLGEIEPLFKWFYEKREDVYTTICATLSRNRMPSTERFARHIIKKTKEGVLKPSELPMIDVMTIWSQQAHNPDDLRELGAFCFDYICDVLSKNYLPEYLIRAIMYPVQYDVKDRNFKRIKAVVTNAAKWFQVSPEIPLFEEHYVLMFFYTAIIAFVERNYSWFVDAGSRFLRLSESFMNRVSEKTLLDIPIQMIQESRDTAFSMGIRMNEELNALRGGASLVDSLGRNDRVVVYDHIHKCEITVKVKSSKRELQSGFYQIREILSN